VTFPTVSVVIPCYNASAWVRRSIESVLDKQSIGLEVIVIDDGSTDNTLEVVKSLGTRVIWKSGPNRGACAARNCGLELATSEFIIFLDADDYIEQNSLSEWVACASHADLVFGPFVYEVGRERIFWKCFDRNLKNYAIVSRWLDGQFTPCCSVLWRRSFLQRIGGWNPCVLRNQDGEVTIRALLLGARIRVAHRGLGVYVGDPNPDRISKRNGRDEIASHISSYEGLWMLTDPIAKKQTQMSFARGFYRLAYQAFASGFDDLGHKALSKARKMGLRGHPGTLPHRCLSHLVGLRNKLRLAGVLKSRKQVTALTTIGVGLGKR
jgi:glycosyltransferase involved in cell wall biosynthesis